MKTKAWKVGCFVFAILVWVALEAEANWDLCKHHGCVIDTALESTQVVETK